MFLLFDILFPIPPSSFLSSLYFLGALESSILAVGPSEVKYKIKQQTTTTNTACMATSSIYPECRVQIGERAKYERFTTYDQEQATL